MVSHSWRWNSGTYFHRYGSRHPHIKLVLDWVVWISSFGNWRWVANNSGCWLFRRRLPSKDHRWYLVEPIIQNTCRTDSNKSILTWCRTRKLQIIKCPVRNISSLMVYSRRHRITLVLPRCSRWLPRFSNRDYVFNTIGRLVRKLQLASQLFQHCQRELRESQKNLRCSLNCRNF